MRANYLKSFAAAMALTLTLQPMCLRAEEIIVEEPVGVEEATGVGLADISVEGEYLGETDGVTLLEVEEVADLESVDYLDGESGSAGGGVTWKISGNILTLSGKGGADSFDSSDPAPWASAMNKNSSTTYLVVVEKGITDISAGSFTGLNIVSISIPSTVTVIGSDAFNGCKKLTSLTIPASVTKIGDTAFKNCSALKTVTFKGTAPTMGEDVFAGCTLTGEYSKEWDEAELDGYGGNITWKKVAGGSDDSGSGTTGGGSTDTDPGSGTVTSECEDGEHVMDDGTVTTPATYGSKGVMTYKCMACGKVLKTKKIARLMLDAPTIGAVKNKSGQKISVKWREVDNATGYLVQYATKDSFSGRSYVRVKGSDTLSTVLTGVEMGAMYYVRVRAYIRENGKNHYSGFSRVKSVEITK